MANIFKNVMDPLGLTVDDDMGTTFVTSGTSVIGYRVAKALLDAGYKRVRVGIWKGKRQKGIDQSIGQEVLQELEALGATIISFDWTKEEQYVMALSGVTSVFCTIPHMVASIETISKFVDACHKANVKHFVKTSFYKVASDSSQDAYASGVPYVQVQRGGDDAVTKHRIDSRMTYTLLCASHLMSTPLVYQSTILRKEHKYITASYAMGVNYVSPNDVAAAAVVALVNRKKHRNKVYTLTGLGYIRDKDVCKLLSKFIGVKIEHVSIGFHEFEEELQSRKYPKWLVSDLALIEKIKASGIEENKAAYTNDLEAIIGRKPQQFKEYLDSKDEMTRQEKGPTQADL